MALRRRSVALGLASAPLLASAAPALAQRLQPLLSGPAPLAGLAAACWRGGTTPQLVLLGDDGNGQPVQRDTLWRIASISKLAQAVVALRLQQRGLLDLDAPLSPALGFRLRHPDGHEPTARQLLSHQAGLRDNGDDGLHLPRQPLSPAVLAPLWGERRFAYANFNSVLLGTALEALSGQRYDDLLQAELFGPLGMEAGFDTSRFSRPRQRRVATLQRRVGGRWQAQTPSLQRQAAAPRVGADYQPGRNCVALGPQGNLHTSLDGLMRLAEALRRQDPALLPPAGHAQLATPQWQGTEGLFRAWSSGAQLFTDQAGGDRLHPAGGWQGLGHLGEAYGLLSGLIVRPATAADPGWALVFLLHGCSHPVPAGAYSAFSRWEESLLTALTESLPS